MASLYFAVTRCESVKAMFLLVFKDEVGNKIIFRLN